MFDVVEWRISWPGPWAAGGVEFREPKEGEGAGRAGARGRRAGHPRVLIAQFSYIFANYCQNKTLQRHFTLLLRIS